MRRHIIALLSAPALVLGLAAPAMATGPVMPPTVPDTENNRYLYQLWFADTPAAWVPRGEIVADSGFRPEGNGFPYPNFGDSYSPLNLFWDMPSGTVEPLSSATMRDLYGDGVCLTTRGTEPGGDCLLTPAAEYMAEYIYEAASGGHCYGFAATASAVYDGSIAPQAVGAQTLMTQSTLTNATQQLITRNWAAQLTTRASQQTPVEIVQTLIADLDPGQSPFVLSIEGDVNGKLEGHAITPYAVFDRGNGVYDIGVYDNNYPGRQRAVHVDTVANTWEYLMQTNPGSGAPAVMSGDATSFSMQLTPVAEILAQQPCIVCDGGDANNLVTLDPTPLQAGQLGLELLDVDSDPLPADRYTILPALTPLNDEEQTYQAASVSPGDGFILAISGSDLSASVPVVARDHSGGSVKVVRDTTLPVGFGAEVVLDKQGLLAFVSDTPSKPRMEHAFNEGARHYTTIVYGGQQVAADNGRAVIVRTGLDRILYGDLGNVGGSMTVVVSLERVNGERKFRATNVAYPAGGQLVLDYSDWKRTNQRPAFGIDTDGDGTIDQPVKMRRVGR